MKYLSFDVGGTNTKYSIIDEGGKILESDKFKTIDNKRLFLDKVKEILEKYKKENIQGIAFSMPGIIDSENGYMITGGALLDFYDFDFKKEMEKEIKLPIELENDVNCVAYAEKWLGNAKKLKNFLCLTIGTGVGGAVFIDDKLYKGTTFAAGEFGFMITNRKKKFENVTLSMNGSVRGGIIQKYAEKKNIDWTTLTGETIFEKAVDGDVVAKEVIEEFYDNLAYAIYNLGVCLNPEKILVGGEITEREDFITILNKKIEKIKEENYPLKFAELSKCKFLNDSGKIGALYHFLMKRKIEKREGF